MGKNDEENVQHGATTSMHGDLSTLKSQRKTMKRNISKLKSKAEKEGTSADYTITKCRLQILESYFTQLSHIQTQIERSDPADEGRSDCEELFIHAKALIVNLLDKKRSSNDDDPSYLNVTNSTYTHQNRLPKLKLPTFDGKYAEYFRFISTFTTLVHEEPCIPTIDKFNYLLNCLSGQALAVVKPYPVTDDNYQKALDRLKERYDNKPLIFIDQVNALFSIAPIKKPNGTELQSILDKVAAIRSSLLSLGSEADVMNAIIIHIVLTKIDLPSKAAYDERQDLKTLPSWDECYNLLSRRCQILESHTNYIESSNDHVPKPRPKLRPSASTFVTSPTICEYCQNKEHSIINCTSYLSLPTARRFEFVKASKLCINCLRKGHVVAKCQSKSRCRHCRVSHHTTLHNGNYESVSHHDIPPIQPSSSSNCYPIKTLDNQSSSLIHSSLSSSNQSDFTPRISSSNPSTSRAAIHITTYPSPVINSHRCNILPTAIVLIKDNFGIFQPARALLDSCSEINLITQEAVHRLHLQKFNSTQEVAGVSDIRTKLKYKVSATFFVTKSISSMQPQNHFDIRNWNIPKGIELADPQFYLPQRVDLLLSSELFFELLLNGKISCGYGLPHMLNTHFGWVIGGKIESVPRNDIVLCNVITTYPELDSMLKMFWEIEEFSTNVPRLSEEENQCEQHFVQNTVFNHNGRVKVCLPFKFSSTHLGHSFEIARRRLLYLEKRLSKDESLQRMYTEFMTEYAAMGHMSLVSSEVLNGNYYVIPHHPVLRLQSSTTKLRVVFDASARTSTNVSLNEILMVGPTIQQDLITTVLSFRLHKYALSADIVTMYRQFLVSEKDRKFQLILWRNNTSEPISIYQLNTVTYGTSAAPFLAIRSLFFIADAYQNEFSMGSKILKQDLYVDDLLTGASTIAELALIKDELVGILEKAGLQLSKWSSNHEPLAHGSAELEIKPNNDHITTALGLFWKPTQDLFCFRFNLLPLEIPTKRPVLSAVARIFDVLGLLSPIVISCKILIQEMWKKQLDWDAPLSDRLKYRWLEIEKYLPFINKIEVPRFVHIAPNIRFDIHGFADASQMAYGCCIYVRVSTGNSFLSTLLIAKSKVAPVIQKSLPRLELCAALLLSRTWEKIRHKFKVYSHRTIFWSDSKIVLSWLTSHSSSFVCFVANRVSEIQNLTHDIEWRHVPSKQNPADVVSRGCLANELSSTIWFSGPEFLKKEEEDWPKGYASPAELPVEEMRKSSFKTLIVEKSIISKIVDRHSSYLRILHILTYVHRLFHRDKRNLFVTSEEIQLCFWKVVHDIQCSAFSEEISLLMEGKVLQPSLQKLSPFLHYMPSYKKKILIIRVGGRLANSTLSFDAKFPALLPKTHHFTTLYIKYLHLKYSHAGPKALLGILRQKIWVINAREVVRKVVRNCVHCFKYKPQLMQQVMGDLPADRVRAQRPFLVCGIDFCGPFYTSYRIRGKPPYKTYVAIFVCFASKAIHIELVSDLSTDTFLLCLKRFIGRRGIPQRLHCDNATNFVGAHHKLQELKQHFFSNDNVKALMHYAEVIGFKFIFIPPRSPHFGGLWESAVKSTKTILMKNISAAGVTYEEFQTILIEIEAILNSRPISPRSDDPNDGEAFTPAHLLIGSSLLALPDENLEHYKNVTYLKRFQLLTYLKQQFWLQWVRDYVLTLQQKEKWFKATENVREGRLVIVHEDNLPPQHRLLARVIKAIPGRDGKVRVVDLKTKKGVYRRPIHKIAPLPMDETS